MCGRCKLLKKSSFPTTFPSPFSYKICTLSELKELNIHTIRWKRSIQRWQRVNDSYQQSHAVGRGFYLAPWHQINILSNLSNPATEGSCVQYWGNELLPDLDSYLETWAMLVGLNCLFQFYVWADSGFPLVHITHEFNSSPHSFFLGWGGRHSDGPFAVPMLANARYASRSVSMEVCQCAGLLAYKSAISPTLDLC